MIFLIIFFSLAFLFRTNISGIDIYIYQFMGILFFIYFIIKCFKNKYVIKKGFIPIIFFSIIYVLFSVLSYLNLDYVNLGYSQYIKNFIELIFKISLFISILIYLDNEDKGQVYKKNIVTSIKILIFYGIVQILFFILNYDINEFIVNLFNLSVSGNTNNLGEFFRVSSLTWDSNYFGNYCIIYMFIILNKKNLNKSDKIFFVLAFNLILLTFSKTAYLGVAILVVYMILNRFNMLLRYKKIIFINILIIITTYIIFYDVLNPIIIDRFGFIIGISRSKSSEYRYNIINLGIDLVKDNFLLGMGIGNFSAYSLNVFGNDFVKFHNTFIQIAVEQGILSLISYLMIIISVCFYSLKKKIINFKFCFYFLLCLFISNLTYDFLLSFYWFLIFIYFILEEKEI